jgi:hypothetical protein
MPLYIRIIFISNFISTLISCQSNGQKNDRKDAVNFVNSIDSLTNTLGPPANNLVAYFKKVIVIAKTNKNYQLIDNQIDSLKYYYETLIFNYDNAISITTLLKKFDTADSLRNNFLTLLKKGKEPWAMIIPIYIKVFREGWDSISDSEQNIIVTSDSIFNNSGRTELKWSQIVDEQEKLLIKKYRLTLHNDVYR